MGHVISPIRCSQRWTWANASKLIRCACWGGSKALLMQGCNEISRVGKHWSIWSNHVEQLAKASLNLKFWRLGLTRGSFQVTSIQHRFGAANGVQSAFRIPIACVYLGRRACGAKVENHMVACFEVMFFYIFFVFEYIIYAHILACDFSLHLL